MNGSPSPRSHGRPAHPPFTAFPVAAYVFTAAFDVVSAIGRGGHRWSEQLWHAGTFVLVAGLAICLVTMGTGYLDLIRFPIRSAAATRSIATHVCLMAAAFMIGAGDIAWRLGDFGSATATPLGVTALSVAAAATACTGAFFGGKLVFRHGVGVAADALEEPQQAAGGPAADGLAASAATRQPPRQPDTLT
jgi:uncharacterized membrane protein